MQRPGARDGEVSVFDALPVALAHERGPILIVVVDTEEEFDWARPHSPRETSVSALRFIERVQTIFDVYGITPTYVVDYPVATQPERGPLVDIHRDGRAVIGAHLHPWVNPPGAEAARVEDTYPGNLPRELEGEKLRVLTDAIASGFGERPRVYKAGRYGFGPNTAALLLELGYEVDLSVCPAFDLSSDGGPDYSLVGPDPSWLGDLLEVPCTGAFVGRLARKPDRGRGLYALATSPPGLALHAPGLLARLGLLDRLMLSPEGFTPREHRKLTAELLARGTRVFSWTFHSPTVQPGCTPYVRTEGDLARFLDAFRLYFDHFFGELGGIPMTPLELKRHLEEDAP
jgi:hypothetical protein